MTCTVEVLDESEGTPAAYPDPPAGLSTAAAALSAETVWGRIEAWIAYRWEERTVVWTIQGPGTFRPPLKPATITLHEWWTGTEWQETTLDAAPLGLMVPSGTYRITATVGADEAPDDAILEAYRRLAEYWAASDQSKPGIRRHSKSVDDLSISFSRDPAHIAKAIHNCGAADLLREYRR